jgi:hypothetical protein
LKKTKPLEWNAFLDGDVVEKKTANKLIPATLTGVWIVNKAALASAAVPNDATGLGRLMAELLSIADYVATGGLIFAGASWMFNNRTVAIERGIGVTAGYLIIRKSWDYVQFLKSV